MAPRPGASRPQRMPRQGCWRDWPLPYRRVRARDDDRANSHCAGARRAIPSLRRLQPQGAAPSTRLEEIACARQRLTAENLSMIGLRFRGDPFVPDERFEALRHEFGERFEPIELNPADANPDAPPPPHSVLTLHLRDDDRKGPTRMAEARVITFLKERLSPSIA